MFNLTRMNLALIAIFVLPLLLSNLLQWTSVPIFCPLEDVKGKTVLITGASSGIGKELALDFAERGSNLLLVARRVELLNETADLCRQRGVKVVSIAGDLALESVSDQIVETVKTVFDGKLHVTILNHAVVPSSLIVEAANYVEHLQWVLETNTISNVRLSELLLPLLERTEGRLVAIGSTGQHIPQLFLSAYSVSKVALQTYIDHLRMERSLLGGRTRIQYITLGEVSTEMLMDKHQEQSWLFSPWLISPKQASQGIQCAIDRDLTHSYVPNIMIPVGWVGWTLRPYWAPITEYVWVNPKQDLKARLTKARQACGTAW